MDNQEELNYLREFARVSKFVERVKEAGGEEQEINEGEDIEWIFCHCHPGEEEFNALFDPYPNGEEVRERFEKTVSMMQENSAEKTDAENAISLIKEYVGNLAKLSFEEEDEEFLLSLQNAEFVELPAVQFPDEPPEDEMSPDYFFNDHVSDTSAVDSENPIYLFKHEAMLRKFNDSSLIEYVLWPISLEKEKGDLFLPYFKLQSFGVKFSFPSDDKCIFTLS